MNNKVALIFFALSVVFTIPTVSIAEDDPQLNKLTPFLKKHCYACHSAAAAAKETECWLAAISLGARASAHEGAIPAVCRF